MSINHHYHHRSIAIGDNMKFKQYVVLESEQTIAGSITRIQKALNTINQKVNIKQSNTDPGRYVELATKYSEIANTLEMIASQL